ncbi:MAG: hypothetical protein Q8N98_03060 [bacterium]|nr:hypothetical protein [bacterium]
MPKITFKNGEITSFQGDAIICPSDVNLTNKRSNEWICSILSKAGPDLAKELSAIGYCEIGNAVITKAYDLKVRTLRANPPAGGPELLYQRSETPYPSRLGGTGTGVKHLIFFPISAQDDEEHKLNLILFHQAFRSAFNLATLYGIKTLAMPLPSLKRRKEGFFNELAKSLFGNENKKGLTGEEIMNIITAVSGEYKNTSLETIMIYR